MPLLIALLLAQLFFATWWAAFQLSMHALGGALGDFSAFEAGCPVDLGDYLAAPPRPFPTDDEGPEPCLPPRSDHAAPGLARGQAPAALCLLLREANLPMDRNFNPYRHHKERLQRCA